LGVIVDGDGKRLASEFATPPSELLPDFARTTKQSQVQIYETRHTDCQGKLTASFVHLCDEVKDNRILPQGWSASVPFAKDTHPVAVKGPLTPEIDQLSYSIPLDQIAGAAAVRATLCYQSIPPYYLTDRSALLEGSVAPVDHPEIKRLFYMALHLDVADPQVGAASWKLPLACQVRPIRGGKETECP
jgi:hypothetical protein